MIEEGREAPDFSVKDHTGRDVKLSDYRGKNVLLWFYPKADTPGCTAEGCGFRDRKRAYADKDVQVLGVSFDGVDAIAKFHEKYGFTFPLLSDADRKVGVAYGATEPGATGGAKRISYLIGPDGRIRKAYPKVTAASHPEDVLKDL